MKNTFYLILFLFASLSSCKKESFDFQRQVASQEMIFSDERDQQILKSNKNTEKDGKNSEVDESQQEVLSAIQLGLIDLAEEDKFINIIKDLSEQAGQDQQYTFSTQSIISVYNTEDDDLLEKVYQSALVHSGYDEEIAQLAQNSFEFYTNDAGAVRYPMIANPFVLDIYPLSDEYADWDGKSPQYVASASNVEGSEAFGYYFNEEPTYFSSPVSDLVHTPGWFLSDDSSPNPTLYSLVTVGRCPTNYWDIQECHRANQGSICGIKVFGGFVYTATCEGCYCDPHHLL